VTTQQQISICCATSPANSACRCCSSPTISGVVAQLCDDLCVIYAGQTVESGDTADILGCPRHPYTKALLACHPTGQSPSTAFPALCRRRCEPGPAAGSHRAAPKRATCAERAPSSVSRRLRPAGRLHPLRSAGVGRDMTDPAGNIVEMEDVTVLLGGERRWLRASVPPVRAVGGVSLTVRAGEILGLVGESGCGKTTLGRTLLGLQRETSGEIRLHGSSVSGLSPQGARRVAGRSIMSTRTRPPRSTRGGASAAPSKRGCGSIPSCPRRSDGRGSTRCSKPSASIR
jgi:peptide/nickel transport system ATP-binding protein